MPIMADRRGRPRWRNSENSSGTTRGAVPPSSSLGHSDYGHTMHLRWVFLFALTIACIFSVPQASGQVRPPPWTSPASEPTAVPAHPWHSQRLGGPATDEPSAGWMLLGGVIGGAAGLVGGAYAGYKLERATGPWPGSSEYFPAGALWGAIAGESLLLPLGVHWGGGRRGSYARAAFASVSVTGIGLLLAVPTSGVSMLLVPPVQLIASMTTQSRRTTPR